MKNIKTSTTVVPATAGNLKKENSTMMKIIGNTLVVGAEKDYTLQDGSVKKVRPIIINGAESNFRLYRSEKVEHIDGQNVTTVKWVSSQKHPTTLKSMKALPIKKAFNREGKEYSFIPVEGNVPKGMQISAFPSQFNEPGKPQAVRVLITVYSEYQD